MCGAHSALGLQDVERDSWSRVRERLREPGQLLALMRGVLGGDTEVAVAATVTPEGIARPVAVLVGPELAAEIELADASAAVSPARLGPYDVEVVVVDGRPSAILLSPWLRENLTVYARKLWTSRRVR